MKMFTQVDFEKTTIRAIAANPQSPLSPFCAESKELRLKALKIFEDVVTGSGAKFHSGIKTKLPKNL